MKLKRILLEAPAELRLTRIWRAVRRSSVPVILLHGILPDADTSPFNSSWKFISPASLKRTLERLTRIFRVVSVDDLLARVDAGERPDNMALVTCDDGYENVYTYGYPVFRQLGLTFTVFVTTSFTDTEQVMWTDRLEFAISSTREKILPKGVLPTDMVLTSPSAKMAAVAALKNTLKKKANDEALSLVEDVCRQVGEDRKHPKLKDVGLLKSHQIMDMSKHGILFGGHGVSHAILSRESPERVRKEITECKRTLEAITGKSVHSFAYPNGFPEDFNHLTKEEVRLAGYKAAFTNIYGQFEVGDDLFDIRRIALDNRWTCLESETRLSGLIDIVRR